MDLTKIKRFFTHEWQSKLISLLLAIALWFYVNYLKNQMEYNFTVPIRFENLPSDMTIVYSSLKNAYVIINIRRDQRETRDYSKEIKVWVDLSDAHIGEANFPIQMSVSDPQLHLKPHLKYDQVSLIIDKKVNKNLPVKVKLLGAPAPGYFVEEMELDEKTTMLSGPSQRLALIDSIETSPLDITQLTNTITANVRINNPESTTILGKPTINVKVVIKENQMNKKIDLPVNIQNLRKDLVLKQPYTVTVQAAFEGKFTPLLQNIKLEADASTITKPGIYNLRILDEIPEEIKLSGLPNFIRIEALAK